MKFLVAAAMILTSSAAIAGETPSARAGLLHQPEERQYGI
jgi:hypothetical protein